MPDIVYAYRPRKVDAHFHIADTPAKVLALVDDEGAVNGDQCDTCGSYTITGDPTGYTVRDSMPDRPRHGRHEDVDPLRLLGIYVECDGCKARYPVDRLEAERVVF